MSKIEPFSRRWYSLCKIVRSARPFPEELTLYAVVSPDEQLYLDQKDLQWKDKPRAMNGWFLSEQEAREALARVELFGRMSTLSFKDLQQATAKRGQKCSHARPSLEISMLELAGEVGEACNIAKKLALHQMGIPVASSDVRTLIDELADVAICLALVANKLGIDLGESVARKFNATSRKHGFSDTLPETNQTIPPIFQTP